MNKIKKMEEYFFDYRDDTLEATRDIRTRLKVAKSGQSINFVCKEDQIFKFLREITFNNAVITSQETTEEGVFIILQKS